MSTSRDDVQDSTGRRTFISGEAPVSGLGGGALRGFPMNASDANFTTGVPINGKAGFLPGAQFQNFKGTAGSVFYINTGTVASATWVELTGGGSGTGNFTTLTVTGNSTLQGGTITVSAAATTLVIKAATANAFIISDGVVNNMVVDTSTTATTTNGLGGTTFIGEAMTFVSGAGAFAANTIYAKSKTVTLTGAGTTTSLLGCGAFLDTITATDAAAGTLTTLSNFHINANAAAGGLLTITNSYMISTSVAGCFLTNAGVFTSTSTEAHKEEIADAEAADVFGVLDSIKARAYKWKKEIPARITDKKTGESWMEMIPLDDRDRIRYGLIAEELPEALRVPGVDHSNGLPDGITAAFAVVAAKKLLEENRRLNARLDKLEALLAK